MDGAGYIRSHHRGLTRRSVSEAVATVRYQPHHLLLNTINREKADEADNACGSFRGSLAKARLPFLIYRARQPEKRNVFRNESAERAGGRGAMGAGDVGTGGVGSGVVRICSSPSTTYRTRRRTRT